MSRESHEMILQTEYETGAEEWWCPTCGRRFVAQWAPKYKKIVLSEGNNQALHGGGKGGLQVLSVDFAEPGTVAQEAQQAARNSSSDAQRLEPWIEWLDSVDFDRLWESAPPDGLPDLD